ncbi:MAG: excinuclease ABC subunit UvrA, partial [Planctomycetes bacterium]|nr:excinuclease ABC subunit UvrA [Planctomycetota bacterium]
MAQECVVVRGARQHNLRIRLLRIPKRKLVVFTGVSGSGKSSLAFDTLFAEGQRRYVESLSSYARQFLGQADKPLYDKIEGLAPTIAIAQSRASSNPRSTVGTLTEVWDHMRVLWARVGVPHCPRCDRPIRPLSPQEVVAELKKADAPALLLAPLAENRKGEFRELLEDLRRRGFVRVRADGEVRPIAGVSPEPKRKHTLELVIDRLNPAQASGARLTDSVETALREGSGTVLARFEDAARAPLR